MIHALLEFVANSVRAGATRENGPRVWAFVLILTAIGVALGLTLYAGTG